MATRIMIRSRSLSVPAAKSACVFCAREANCANSASSSVETAFFTCSGFMWADRSALLRFLRREELPDLFRVLLAHRRGLHRRLLQVRGTHYVRGPFVPEGSEEE